MPDTGNKHEPVVRHRCGDGLHHAREFRVQSEKRTAVRNAQPPPARAGRVSCDTDRAARPARSLHVYFKRIVTPPTAADTSAPTLGPLSCRITPLAFCN